MADLQRALERMSADEKSIEGDALFARKCKMVRVWHKDGRKHYRKYLTVEEAVEMYEYFVGRSYRGLNFNYLDHKSGLRIS